MLCCFNNYWKEHDVEMVDLKNGRDVMSLPNDYGKSFDLVLAAPPCEQFTKTNALRWEVYPKYFIEVAEKCFWICKESGKPFLFENVPGRIEKFIPGLKAYRVATWQSSITGKQHIVYSNMLMMFQIRKRGDEHIKRNKTIREMWQRDFVSDLSDNFFR